MRFVFYVWTLLLAIFRALAYEWVLALVSLIRRLREIFRALWSRRKDGRAGKASESPCNQIDEPAYHRPDPMIYSQYDMMAQGLAVVWDNPDIILRKGGVAVSSSNLDPDTEYEIVARIWNKAPDAPIIGLPVLFFFLSFGNGVKGHPIGATAVNLGVKGGPGHPAFALMKWKTPSQLGHFCLMVLLAPADDLNFMNNLGQENLNVGIPHSPAEFSFQLRNEKQHEEIFRFEFDTYRLPELPLCDQQDRKPTRTAGGQDDVPRQPETRARTVPPLHDRRNYPIPPGWSVGTEPREPRLHSDAEMPVRIQIAAPPDFHGRQSFNVNVFDREGFVGGATLVVDAP
jgi:hypothetical protein